MSTADIYSPQGGAYGLAILTGLGKKVTYASGAVHERHVYGGTVSPKTVATRRAHNRVARKARRTNRLRGA